MNIKEYKDERDMLLKILGKVYNKDIKEVEQIIENRLQQIVNDVAAIAFEQVDKSFSWEDVEQENQ